MQLLIQSAMVFFGTLLVAGLLALAEPRVTTVAGPRHNEVAPAVLLADTAVAPATAQPQR
jgi:O-antigen/teichoic acid export membrane protein